MDQVAEIREFAHAKIESFRKVVDKVADPSFGLAYCEALTDILRKFYNEDVKV
jgi:hypothetical protein